MARTVAVLPEGSRITDYVSLGVISKTIPAERIRAALKTPGKASMRERDLPAHVVVCYVIALTLSMHCLPGDAALPARRGTVADQSVLAHQGGRQIGHLAGAHAPGPGAAARTA